MKPVHVIFAVLAASLAAMQVAVAKDAWCYTSDDGEYDCDFQSLDDVGSFRVSADGKPTFELWIESEGRGSVGGTFEAGGRSVPLPGTFIRSEEDPACWVSDATETELCAW